jgi:hypothetical protein
MHTPSGEHSMQRLELEHLTHVSTRLASPLPRYLPAGQLVHTLAPAGEYVFTEQTEHDAAPAPLYLPAVQLVHASSDAPPTWYVPG